MEALEQALEVFQQEAWNVNDDLCDCANQRVFGIFNPYHGVREEIRLCCVFAELRQMWPQHFRTTQHDPIPWNGETDMPRSIWHRQLATLLGVSVTDARKVGIEPPRGTPAPVEEDPAPKPRIYVRHAGDWVEAELG